jgi:hypothetical protein
VVLQDFKTIVETLDRLDWLAEQMETELRAKSQPTPPPAHSNPAIPDRLVVSLRSEQSDGGAPETIAAPLPGVGHGVKPPLVPSPLSHLAPVFQVGQVWQRPDGKTEFRIFAVEEDWIEIQWQVRGQFKTHGRFPVRDLLLYIRENGMQPA